MNELGKYLTLLKERHMSAKIRVARLQSEQETLMQVIQEVEELQRKQEIEDKSEKPAESMVVENKCGVCNKPISICRCK